MDEQQDQPAAQWPTTNHPTEPIAPAPESGFGVPAGPAYASDPAAPVDWQQRFEGERRKSRIFMGATALAGALLVGSLFYASAQGSQSSTTASRMGMGNVPGQGYDRQFGGQAPGLGGQDDQQGQQGFGPRGGAGMGPGAAGQGGMGTGSGGPIMVFFNSDGSLNEAAVSNVKAQIEASPQAAAALTAHIEQELNEAVASQLITQDQADELTKAFDLKSTGSGTSGTGTTNGRTT